MIPVSNKRTKTENLQFQYSKNKAKVVQRIVFFSCVSLLNLELYKQNCNLPIPKGFALLELTFRGSSIDDFPLKLWRPRVAPVQFQLLQNIISKYNFFHT